MPLRVAAFAAAVAQAPVVQPLRKLVLPLPEPPSKLFLSSVNALPFRVPLHSARFRAHGKPPN
jgi:hypothetical protein